MITSLIITKCVLQWYLFNPDTFVTMCTSYITYNDY